MVMSCVVFNLYPHADNFNKMRFFIFLQLTWIVGIIITCILYLRADIFQIEYTSNYIFPKGEKPFPFFHVNKKVI